jgi:hypothetical protein
MNLAVLQLLAIAADPATFVSFGCFLPAAIFKSFLSIKDFYGVGLSTLRPTPNLEDQDIHCCLDHHL